MIRVMKLMFILMSTCEALAIRSAAWRIWDLMGPASWIGKSATILTISFLRFSPYLLYKFANWGDSIFKAKS